MAKNPAFLCFDSTENYSLVINLAELWSTGIPRFTLLLWGHKNKTAEAKTA
jgi:hypothetical protein